MTTAPIVEQVRSIVCLNPQTGERLGEVRAETAADIEARIVRGREAQRAWATTSFSERRRVLRDLLDYTLEYSDELCEQVVVDSGKTKENAMLGEIWPVAEKIRWTLKEGEKHLRPERVSSGLLVHKKATIQFEPLGVVGIITPWNFPFQNIVGPTIPSLFAGNASVVKVSEHSSWSVARIQRMFDEVLNARGHSPDLVQIATGYGDAGAALVSGGVDLVVFTGSMKNGRRVVEGSAKALIPVILELGGKDPMIVCDDAHIPQAAHTALAGTFMTAGQMCMATERIYVFDEVFDAFLGEVTQVARSMKKGVDWGAMTMPGQVDIVERLVNDAVAKGAKVEVGGKRAGGHFFEPTILTNVDHSMAIMQEETFGPVMAIVRVEGEEQAIEMANDTSFGLSSSVFTKDKRRAKRMADRIVAGSTCVNDFGLAYIAQDLPFGGARGSGFGRLNGREGLRACTNQKALLEDRLPIYTPKKLFPVSPGDYVTARSTIKLIYGGWREKARGLIDLVKR